MHEYLQSIIDRDPAAKSKLSIILTYPGVKAVFFHRIANFFCVAKFDLIARMISQFSRFLTGIEIHPRAKIGKNLFIDHGMGVVIGETSVIEDNVSIFQGVTLGGTGKETGDRHPKVNEGVLLSASSTVLGNVQIGRNAKIAAGSVVLENVREGATVAGVPAKEVGQAADSVPADEIDHLIE